MSEPLQGYVGIEPRVGLASSSLPLVTDVIDEINTKDLQNILAQEDTENEDIFAAEELQNKIEIVNLNSENDVNLNQEQNLVQLVQCYSYDNITSENAQISVCRTCQRQVHCHCRGQKTEFQKIRKKATENLIKQPAKMRCITNKTHPNATVADNVTVAIPDADRARGALRNILAVLT
ncbi:hypothetical protein ABEB36_003638 [Hypothenemus hampei]|uniref:Uncharacterized protein n=1 Tax=Hypothenemus hampei TaxID=57062 RepID=A0ABD1FCH7_HYPHA